MAISSVGLKTHIWNNNFKSLVLLMLYPFLVLIAFWTILYIYFFFTGSPENNVTMPDFAFDQVNTHTKEYWHYVLTLCGFWFVISWLFNTSIIGRLALSHPVSRTEEPELYNLLENLCIAQGHTIPKLEIIETHARNAYASGITPDTYTITVTRGLMHSLTKDELECVIAHELTHIINRDVRLMMVAIVFTGMFALGAQLCWRMIRYNLIFSRKRQKVNLFVIVLTASLILAVGYFLTILMRLAISRKREFMADAGAVEMTKNPEAMITALRRIGGRANIPETTNDIAFLCFENRKPLLGLFSTHPPIHSRIQSIAHHSGIQKIDFASLQPADNAFLKNNNEDSQHPWLPSTRGKRKYKHD